MFLLLIYVKF